MLERLRSRVDAVVRQESPIGFLYAVFKKFGEDRAGQLAALVAYYGFFSLFPLMLVLVTVLGVLLRNDPQLQQSIVNSALSQFPIVGDQIRENIRSLNGSGPALLIGVGGALWAGLAGIKAMQNAMDVVWEVPFRSQPNVLKQLLRGVLMLVVLGSFVFVATGLAAMGARSGPFSIAFRVVTLVATLAVDIGVFLLAYRILTTADVSWRDVFPGAVVAGFAWTILQTVGNYYVTRTLKGASQTYGFFGIVLGLLSWMYLASQVTLLAAEVNPVLKWRLWPRSLGSDPDTPADRQALELYAKVQERSKRERVETTFRDKAAAGFS